MLRAVTLSDFAERYLAERPSLSAGYVEELRRVVRQFQAVVGPVPLCTITREHLLDYLCSLRVGAETHNAKRQELLTLLRAACDLKLCDPLRSVPRRQTELRLPTAWTVDEISHLLRVAGCQGGSVGVIPTALWWPAILLTVYDTGARIGELLRVPLSSYQAAPPALVLSAATAKTKRGRWCPLSQQTSSAIEATLAVRQRAPASPQSPLSTLHSPLFPWPHCRRYLFVCFRRLVESAGLPAEKTGRGLFHKLRRTSGSLVEAAGGDGARHLGNTRQVFEKSYLAPAIIGRGQVGLLPRP
jgi:integrase